MRYWLREQRRGWRYFVPRVIWYTGVALFIAAMIYMACQ
jgi:hypothetical protein